MNVTWDIVKGAVIASGPAGMTNRALSERLCANLQDVTLLTRLIWLAGEIDREMVQRRTGAPVATYRAKGTLTEDDFAAPAHDPLGRLTR